VSLSRGRKRLLGIAQVARRRLAKYVPGIFTITGERGAVTALVVLFLPVALLCVGMVADLGLIFAARKCAQAACDLGALAGIQELDWEQLAQGLVFIDVEEGEKQALAVAWANMENVRTFVENVTIAARVYNLPDKPEPGMILEAAFTVRCHFLRWLPYFSDGLRITVRSEASVVERKKW